MCGLCVLWVKAGKCLYPLSCMIQARRVILACVSPREVLAGGDIVSRWWPDFCPLHSDEDLRYNYGPQYWNMMGSLQDRISIVVRRFEPALYAAGLDRMVWTGWFLRWVPYLYWRIGRFVLA
jgi:hypothetical protein